MNRGKQLIINSILYFIGNMGKGLAQIVIILLASFYISPSDMGIFDLVFSTITILQPIIIFQISDGIYRWILDENYNKYDVVKTGLYVAFRNILCANICIIPLFFFISLQHKWAILLLLNINCLYPILQQITRGLKEHAVFAKSGIINSVVLLSLTIYFLVYGNYGLQGLYFAQVIASSSCLAYMILNINFSVSKCVISGKIDSLLLKEMQAYSIVLVPNTLNQWMMKTLDRYFIMYFLSAYYTGIFTIAHRIPDLLIMLNGVFCAAWLEQVITDKSNENQSIYFTKVYNCYSDLAFTSILILMPITKYLIQLTAGKEYHDAYIYVPFLYIGVVFCGLACILGTIYLKLRETRGLVTTTITASIINVVINILFLKIGGLQVASISMVVAYFFMWFIRFREVRYKIMININWKRGATLFLLSILYTIAIVKFNDFVLDVLLFVVALLIFVYINESILRNLNLGLSKHNG